MKSGTSSADRWERLGALLIQRRTQLSPRFHNRGAFCEAAGLNYRLVYDIEEARRTNFGGPVLAAIEVAYRLAPGAIGRFLAGGDLEVQSAAADAAGAADALAVTKAPPPLAAVPAPPASEDDDEDDVFPDMSPEMRVLVDAHVPGIGKLVSSAAIDGPDTAGSVIFPGSPHEAERWDRLVRTGYALNPGRGYPLKHLIRYMAVGRVRDDEHRAGNQPARVRQVLTLR